MPGGMPGVAAWSIFGQVSLRGMSKAMSDVAGFDVAARKAGMGAGLSAKQMKKMATAGKAVGAALVAATTTKPKPQKGSTMLASRNAILTNHNTNIIDDTAANFVRPI